MAEQRPPHVVAPTFGTTIHTPPPEPGPVRVRETTTATRTTATKPAPHPAVYAPWDALLQKAAARFKTEITAALQALEARVASAGQILDTSNAIAAEAGAALEADAWAAWQKYMAAADDTRNSILKAAMANYDTAIGYAHNQYTAALADAAKTYQTILNDANAAKGDAAKIVA